jgi:DNA modification methylase
MGVGLPEYVLLFRKKPSLNDNAYADDPVIKKIDEYLLSLWQLDAHAYWKSSGDRFLSSAELSKMDMAAICGQWKKYDQSHIYSFQEHLRVTQQLDELGKLSKLFMTLPPHSTNDMVWTDINRMNTLNANQVNRKKEKHICPLQLDIIERLIYRFTNPGDRVDDPFGGLYSVPYKCLEMGRDATASELNPEYHDDGLFYLKSIEYKINVPTLFGLLDMEGAA